MTNENNKENKISPPKKCGCHVWNAPFVVGWSAEQLSLVACLCLFDAPFHSSSIRAGERKQPKHPSFAHHLARLHLGTRWYQVTCDILWHEISAVTAPPAPVKYSDTNLHHTYRRNLEQNSHRSNHADRACSWTIALGIRLFLSKHTMHLLKCSPGACVQCGWDWNILAVSCSCKANRYGNQRACRVGHHRWWKVSEILLHYLHDPNVKDWVPSEARWPLNNVTTAANSHHLLFMIASLFGTHHQDLLSISFHLCNTRVMVKTRTLKHAPFKHMGRFSNHRVAVTIYLIQQPGFTWF